MMRWRTCFCLDLTLLTRGHVSSTKSALNRWLSQHKSGAVDNKGRLNIVHEEMVEQ